MSEETRFIPGRVHAHVGAGGGGLLSIAVHSFSDLVCRTGRSTRAMSLIPGTLSLRGVAARACLGAGLDPAHACIVVDGQVLAAGDPAWERTVGREWCPAEISLAPRPGEPTTWILIALAIASAVASAAILSSISAPGITGSNDPEQRRFGFGRFSNEAVAGDLIPTAFGHRVRYGGKVIGKVPAEGIDGEQKVKMLISLGNGPINRIGSRVKADGAFNHLGVHQLTGVYLNDQPLSSFPSVRVWGRFGLDGQHSIPGFADTEVLREVGVGGVTLLNTSGSDRTGSDAAESFTFSTLDVVDAVTIRVRFQRGLYKVSPSGQIGSVRAQYRYRSRLSAGPGAWSAWTVVSLERADQSEVISAARTEDLGGEGADPAGYDVMVQRVSKAPASAAVVDVMLLDAIVETRSSNNRYPGQALLALELTASEQLSTIPRVSVDLEGYADLRIWDGVSDPATPTFTRGYSANPADIALEWLTNKVFGMGGSYADDAVDFASLLSWRGYCAEAVARVSGGGTRPRFAFNHVMDQDQSPDEYLRTVCASGRCVPQPTGNVWRFIVDRPQPTPVEYFGDGSIEVDDAGLAMFTYTRQLVKGPDARDTPNQLVAQFENELQDGHTDVVSHPADGELWLGGAGAEPVRRLNFRLEGVTDPEQVFSEMIYRLDKLRGLSRTVEFVTRKAVVVVQPGDRFDLAMSLPAWGLASGRIHAGAGLASVRLDRSVSLAGGRTYTIRLTHLDGSVDIRTIISQAGDYAGGPAGDLLSVDTAWSQSPAEWCEYAVGEVGIREKPFTCTKVSPAAEAGKGLRWRVAGIEYAATVYDDIPGNVDLPTYTGLTGLATPPGPLKSLRAVERVSNGIRIVELVYTQRPADRENTLTFRAYRRELGTGAWILTPGVTSSLRSTLIELSDLDRAYQFVVVAVSPIGAALSPYDPRNPIANMVFGFAPPPPPPTGLIITQVTGNEYRLDWDPVEEAVEYQVLGGADTTALPNAGAENALVVARVTTNFLAGLKLMPGAHPGNFWVRSVGQTGRLSWTAAYVQGGGALPVGQSIKYNETVDLGAGTLGNAIWDGSRLTLDNPALPGGGSFVGAVQDTGANTLTEITLRPNTINAADDPPISSDPFAVPSTAADQWGVVAGAGQTAEVGMLMPPWPDDEQGWAFEVRTSEDGVLYTAWSAVGVGRAVRRIFQFYQHRITMTRVDAPYLPALGTFRAACTH